MERWLASSSKSPFIIPSMGSRAFLTAKGNPTTPLLGGPTPHPSSLEKWVQKQDSDGRYLIEIWSGPCLGPTPKHSPHARVKSINILTHCGDFNVGSWQHVLVLQVIIIFEDIDIPPRQNNPGLSMLSCEFLSIFFIFIHNPKSTM